MMVSLTLCFAGKHRTSFKFSSEQFSKANFLVLILSSTELFEQLSVMLLRNSYPRTQLPSLVETHTSCTATRKSCDPNNSWSTASTVRFASKSAQLLLRYLRNLLIVAAFLNEFTKCAVQFINCASSQITLNNHSRRPAMGSPGLKMPFRGILLSIAYDITQAHYVINT